uniref:Inositol-1-monophosphatase n=1 Tax=Sphaeramia orbicularis TaxID=375764 RepID=A0A673AS88_9TELE
MDDVLQNIMDHAVAVAREAGQVVREALCDEKQRDVMTKSSTVDLVTQTDQRVEHLIIQSVKKKFPTHRFIGEESVAAGEACVLTDDPTWIIDPIDGTTNFVHSFPFVAVSIGFSVDKKIQFGVVYSCLEDKMFTARRVKEHSVTENHLMLFSSISDVRRSIIATEFGSNRETETVEKIFSSLRNILNIPVHGVRGAGTAAVNMCLVASGCVEAYYEVGVHVWDVAAGSVIVEEAGGVLMDVEGGPVDLMSRRIVAANNGTVAHIVKEIDAFSPTRDDAPPTQ